jgi:hypothetical protein
MTTVARVSSRTRTATRDPRPPASESADDPSPATALASAQLFEPAGEDLAASPFEFGLTDVEAAVSLVESGLASRVVVTGLTPWPGMLWQTHQLAQLADVSIVPTLEPGGRVVIVVVRNRLIDG